MRNLLTHFKLFKNFIKKDLKKNKSIIGFVSSILLKFFNLIISIPKYKKKLH